MTLPSPEPGGAASVEQLLRRMRGGDRDAAAAFMSAYGPRIQRRVRGKLSRAMRRVFDSLEILSTVSRRLDSYVHAGRLEARTAPQLWSLVFRITDAAVIDKVRVFKRLERVEGEDSPLAAQLRARLNEAPEDTIEVEIERILQVLDDETDRQILSLWLAGNEHAVIGEFVGLTPNAARQRWFRIRDRLRKELGGEQR